MNNKDNLYDKNFFANVSSGAEGLANSYFQYLFQSFKPSSIIDVGCATGGWLKTAKTYFPDCSIVGVDGDYVPRDQLLIPQENFKAIDLENKRGLSHLGKFDLAITIEVAEHLSFERSDSFVEDLTSVSDIVLFAAALPFQGGVHHINEQWLEFWAILFRKHGYLAYDPIRKHLIGDPNVHYYARQNALVFAKPKAAKKMFGEPVIDRTLSILDVQTLLQTAGKHFPYMHGQRWLNEVADFNALRKAYVEGETTIPHLSTVADGRVLNPSRLAGDTGYTDLDVMPVSRYYVNNIKDPNSPM